MIKIKINQKQLTILTILAMLYVLPTLLANVYYMDDISRITHGFGWNFDGRLMNTYLSHILSFSSNTFSFFPYSLLLSSLLMLAVGIVLCQILDITCTDNAFQYYLLPLFFLLSPYFLENLAYQYDSLYMALSMCFAIIPLLFWQKKTFIIISSISLYFVFNLFQTSTMLYIASMLCLLTHRSITQKTIEWKLFLSSISAFFIAYFLYKLSLNLLSVDIPRSSLLPFSHETLSIIMDRLNQYKVIYSDLFLKSNYINALTILLILSFLGFVFPIFKKNSFKDVFYKILIPIFCLASIIVCILLPNILLETMRLAPRTLVVFPTTIFFGSIFIKQMADNYNHIIIKSSIFISYIIIFLYSFMLSSVFGNILRNNDEYNNNLAQQSTQIILEHNTGDPNAGLIVLGNNNTAPYSEKLYAAYPIMKWLIPNYLRENWQWGGFISFSKYYNFINPSNHQEIITNICHSSLLYSNSLYNIREVNNTYIIDFKKNCSI